MSVAPGKGQDFDLWRNGMSPLFTMDAADAGARASFRAGLTGYHFADVAIASGFSSAATFERSGPLIARSGLDHICLLVYSEGGCALEVSGRDAGVRVGDLCFLDLSRPMTLRAPDYESLTLVLPRAALESQLAHIDELHGRVLRKSEPLNALLVGHLRTLFAQAPSLGAADGRAAAIGTAALIAAFAGSSEEGRANIAQSGSKLTLLSFRRFIETNLQDFSLGPELLCSRLGVSRSTLYRAFESTGGVANYILQRRLARAHQLIMDPAHVGLRISALAADSGFDNIAVFNRAFRRTYGMSPTGLRDALQRDEALDIVSSDDGGFQAMSRWLLGLEAAGG